MSSEIIVNPQNDNDDNERKSDIDKLTDIARNNAMTASYLIQQTSNNMRQLAELTDKVEDIGGKIVQIEQTKMITPSEKSVLNKRVNQRIYRLLGMKTRNRKLTPKSKKISDVYSHLFHSRLYSDLNDHFGTSQYAEIKSIDFEDAKSFIDNWSPAYGVEDLKREAEDNWRYKHPDLPLSEFLTDDSGTAQIQFEG